MEVVSGGELYTALQAGVPGRQIHFQGNNKSIGELTMALENGVGDIVVDNLSELERLASDYSGKAVSVQVSAPERLHKTEAELKKEFASHPVIKSLTETFGASLIRCIPVEHTRS